MDVPSAKRQKTGDAGDADPPLPAPEVRKYVGGKDVADFRRYVSGASATSSSVAADAGNARASSGESDTEQLDSDLSFILVDKAKLKSEILNRIQNLKAQGGINMYAEVYRWFTEASGLGLMGQAAKLMDPKQAAKEEDVAEAIEQWEEKVNRLARHGVRCLDATPETLSTRLLNEYLDIKRRELV